MKIILIGISLPFIGTILGSLLVFFMKDKLNEKINKLLLGFASGVMIAASVWSLIIPSINMSENLKKLSFLPAVIGFLLGIFFLLILDTYIPHMHINSEETEGVKSKLNKNTMMLFALTLHNIPEGMAVGVVLAGAYYGHTIITVYAALALAIGIAIQNFPEGAITSMPLVNKGMSKPKSFLMGVISGIVEPLFAIVTIFLTQYITPVLPYLLSFAAGAMMYVVVEELIPESQSNKHSNIATIAFAIGFALMMVLDVALG